MKKGLFIFLAVALLALPATVSFSQEQGPGPGTPPAKQGQRPRGPGSIGDPQPEWMQPGRFGHREGWGRHRMQRLRLLQTNPKLAGLLMQMRGEMMMKQGEVLMKYGKQIESLPAPPSPAERRE